MSSISNGSVPRFFSDPGIFPNPAYIATLQVKMLNFPVWSSQPNVKLFHAYGQCFGFFVRRSALGSLHREVQNPNVLVLESPT